MSESMDLVTADTYINRELSWLEFNQRVFALTGREDFPLLEKAKFLAIWSSNLDRAYEWARQRFGRCCWIRCPRKGKTISLGLCSR